jgi:hypothetical protein
MLDLFYSSNEIRCAFYDLDLPLMIATLKEKDAFVVLENDNSLKEFSSMFSPALMHHKFCVLDGKVVTTGSMNPTERDNYFNNNNLVIIRSEALSKNYLDEWEEVFQGRFSQGKLVKNPIIYVGEIKIENYFCPEDNCKGHVIDVLKTANRSIYFMTFSFTDSDIGNLLWNKEYAGLDVKGIFEKSQLSEYSVYEDLKHFSIIDKNKYNMHNKVFIIDEKIVVTGSFNPSKNANERNEENVLIIHDENIAMKYAAEFRRLWEKNEELPSVPARVMLSRVLYDAQGSDAGKEYVEIENIGDEIEYLDYYSLSDNKTNDRLDGAIAPGEVITLNPGFDLKNSEGMLYLNHNGVVVDYVYWEGLWSLEGKEGVPIVRSDTKIIGEGAWK